MDVTITVPQIVVACIAAMGIPSCFCSMMFRRLEKKMDKREAMREEKEANTEKLMLMIMQSSRANNVLAEATARAVQRIPDANCNGDMTAALERAAKIKREEQQFLIDQGVKHIFGE